ncbi:MAG: S8/S53 family peptidase [Gemmatimonadaceae bacterium]|nr:S8/S53 family peptidase [Gemmatimonadaceae bacterium]
MTRRMQAAGHDPLLVVAAGNYTNIPAQDVFWSGWGSLKRLYPGNVIVVGSASTNPTLLSSTSGRGPQVTVAALGEGVYSATRGNAEGTAASGSSFAAPQVAGIAGLLKSIDRRLTSSTIVQLVEKGAVRSQRGANGIPLPDAYESLKLAAQRPGAPICGNRVWTKGTGINIQRGTTTETLATALPVTDTIRSVEVQHGGRLIEYEAHGNQFGRKIGTLIYQNGAWISSPSSPPLSPHSSGTWLSMRGTSHDQDSTILFTYRSGGSPADP